MNLNWEKFTLYVIAGYVIYYVIAIGLDFIKKKKTEISKDDTELLDIDCLIEEVPQVVESISISEELEAHNKKKNYFKHGD